MIRLLRKIFNAAAPRRRKKGKEAPDPEKSAAIGPVSAAAEPAKPAPVPSEPVSAEPLPAGGAPAPFTPAESAPAPFASAPAESAPAPAVSTPIPAVSAPVAPSAPRRFHYDRSFSARLIQSDEAAKSYYCMLKSEILAYGAKSRVSWKHEAFRAGKLVIKMTIRGKMLCLFFALPVAEYLGTKYKVEDMTEVAAYAQTPCLYRIANERRSRYAVELIAAVMAAAGREKKGEGPVLAAPPYEKTAPLLARGLIRIVEGGSVGAEDDDGEEEAVPAFHSVRVSETSVLADEAAAALVDTSVRYADPTKTGVINIDTLSQNFKNGETVTLEEIKKRITGYKKVTYIKVLARGVLDKALTVEADEFSIEAVKMIVLTGGKVVRTRRLGE